MASRLYFRQLLSGRDFARGDEVARQMRNFVYLIGDREAKEALLVDPAYRVGDLFDLAEADGMQVSGVLATHFHPDHVGGAFLGIEVEGVREVCERRSVPVHVQRDEAPWIKEVTGLSDGELALHDGGDVVRVGAIDVTLIHTPGHTPGSQCFLVLDRLVSGDTLFLQGCGRTDLPGGDPAALHESLTRRLAHVPDEAVLFPGHLYAPEGSATLGETRRTNYVFKPRTAEEWLARFGR